MKQPGKFLAFIAAAVVFTACQKDIQELQPQNTGEETSEDVALRHNHGYENKFQGYVYTLSNDTKDNKVLVYGRSYNGEITFLEDYSTGGKGTGSGLGNQGALILTEDGNMLLTVNPASNTIASFNVNGKNLHLASVVYSGGTTPVSITEHDNLVYVLNSGGSGNITGFKLGNNGKLYPIHYSTQPLSSDAAGAAQVSFVNDGKVLAITEKATNKIITYTVDHWGRPGAFHSITAANATPFGFAVGRFGKIIVSEAAGGAAGASTLSSYHISYNGAISLVEGPVSANQTAACWVVLTDNNWFAYTTNTGSNNISSFKSGFGSLTVLDENAAPAGMAPIDADLSDKSKYLYVLNSGSHSISAYEVNYNGSLNPIQTVAGVPAGATGMAAN